MNAAWSVPDPLQVLYTAVDRNSWEEALYSQFGECRPNLSNWETELTIDFDLSNAACTLGYISLVYTKSFVYNGSKNHLVSRSYHFYSVMQSDWNSFRGDVVLDSSHMSYTE